MFMSAKTERVSPAELQIGDKIELGGDQYFVRSSPIQIGTRRWELDVEENRDYGDRWRYGTAPGEMVTRILADALMSERMPGAHL